MTCLSVFFKFPLVLNILFNLLNEFIIYPEAIQTQLVYFMDRLYYQTLQPCKSNDTNRTNDFQINGPCKSARLSIVKYQQVRFYFLPQRDT